MMEDDEISSIEQETTIFDFLSQNCKEHLITAGGKHRREKNT